MTQYAEVILPLPLEGSFTYKIPDEMVGKIKPGHRVIVPFGAKRYYTAIVEAVTPIKPKAANIKDVAMILDHNPIVRHPQLKFWHWIADYYLCPIGDVFKAALPAGLKVESETVVEFNSEVEPDILATLNESEYALVAMLKEKGRMSTKAIEKECGHSGVTALITQLLEREIVMVSEKLVERYRAVRKHYVAPTIPRHSPGDLTAAFAAVKGAKKQETALLALLSLSGFNRPDSDRLVEVSKDAILGRTGLTWAIVQALAKKKLCRIYSKEISRFSYSGQVVSEMPKLSKAQDTALTAIHQSFMAVNTTLLHGVTSSGKTEIYIHLIDRVLQEGNQALFLVPEIALTTQLTQRLQHVFGDKVVIYHSKFSDNERVDIWRKLLNSSEPMVVIGARSAIFLPFSKLGIIIVDEEHEPSYKQFDPAPRYNARDCAIVLASMHGAKVLLGSATPSIETYYKATHGKYGLVSLPERYEGAKLPEIEVIDMAQERNRKAVNGTFATALTRAANEAISNKQQVILFHNRRGYSPFGRCKLCQFVPKCDHCDVSLTYHRHPESLVCHYCGAVYPVMKVCPSCHEPAIEIVGYGTERIEDDIAEQFADAKVLRMDLDTTRNKDSYDKLIDDFSQHKADILIGTQMVTKGLDFSDVSLVGIINADTIINIPDFRSAERAFNMLEQVSGRAGRRSADGKVLIQTYKPDHPVIQYVRTHDYLGFYNNEIAEREAFSYPPFTRIINIFIKHKQQDVVERMALEYATRLRALLGSRVSGPDEPAVSRIQSLYIRKVMLKLELNASIVRVKEILRQLYIDMQSSPTMRGLTLYYDVDPA
jgi:primosomal protein N' (replication factor Y)